MNKDREILDCIRSGRNSPALSYLYENTLRKVRYYIMKNGGSIDHANDIFQDGVVILFNQVKKNKFDERFEIDGFVYAVCRNLWINRVRNEKRMSNYEDMNVFGNIAEEAAQLSDLITKEKSEAVHRLFEQLNEKCRKILHYYNHEGWSMKEISEKLGYNNEKVAKASHYRCKQHLMKLVHENKELQNLLRN